MHRLLFVCIAVLLLSLSCAKNPQPAATPPRPAPEAVAGGPPPRPPVALTADEDAPASAMTAHFIDVGQANATLLEFPCGAVLIDAGAQSADHIPDLLAYLDDFFRGRPDLTTTLDALFITHNHVDHTRALREVIERFTVKRLIENGQRGGMPEAIKDLQWAQKQASQLKLKYLDVDDSDVPGGSNPGGLTNSTIDPLTCSGTNPDIRILSADLADNPDWPNDDFKNKNNHSLVVKVAYGKSRFLFTGDLEEPAIETMVEYYQKTSMLDIDVYEVGHHGSHNGTTQSLLDAMTPLIAVISMGPSTDEESWTAWAYGHPRLGTVDLLIDSISRPRNSAKAVKVATAVKKFKNLSMSDAIYGTGWDGTVRVRATAAGTFVVNVDH